MTDEQAIEEVAKALHHIDDHLRDWDTQHPHIKDLYRANAAQTIDVLRTLGWCGPGEVPKPTTVNSFLSSIDGEPTDYEILHDFAWRPVLEANGASILLGHRTPLLGPYKRLYSGDAFQHIVYRPVPTDSEQEKAEKE